MNSTQKRPSPGDDNLAQLKQDIDSGRTGDKVANSDPGLSPLGTDDEAGGNPPTPAQVSLARQQEARIGAAAHTAGSGSAAVKKAWPLVVMIGIVAVFIVVIVAWGIVGY